MECPACHHPNIDGARFCAKCGAPLPSAPSEEDPLIGSIVGGRYRITGVLGEGGMGRVYTAEQQMGTTVRKAAVKTLLAQYAKDPQVLARFNRECGTVAELKHPNTIQVWDFGQTNTGELYIAMELLEGSPLEDALAQGGPMPPERVDKIIGQVSGSLQEAHNKGIVHRDLKPANIFLTKLDNDDFVKVLDFGIAKRSERPDSKEQKLTQQGTVLGTPPYMSPEQFRGQELDSRSDVYSLAVVAYEMLTGRLPFDADTPWAWATQHLTAQPFPFEVTPLGAQLPAKMKNAIMRALEKDKNKRQATVKEFYEELSIGASRGSIAGVTGQQQQTPGTAMMPGMPSGQMPGYPSAQMPGYPSAQMPGYASGPMAARGGATQIGEPLFAQGGPPGQPGGRTMVDTGQSAMSMTPQPMPAMGTNPHAMQPGPAYQPPPPPMASRPQKNNMMPVVAGVGVLAVLGIGIAIFALKGKSSGDGNETIILPSSAPTTVVVASDTPTTTATPSDSAAPASSGNAGGSTTSTGQTNGGSTSPTTTGSGSGTKVDAAGDKACDTAIAMGLGGNTILAVNQYRSCTGPKRSKALAAIDSSALREVKSKGCGGKPAADAAAGVGASSGKNALPKNCR